MKSVTQCLQAPDIEAFLSGTVTTSQSELWEEHFSSCESCRVAVASRIGDQDWWNDAEQSLMGADFTEGRDPSSDTPDGSRCTANDSTDEHESTDELLKLLGPTDDPRMLGRLGTYEVLGVLGRGGMGIVFKAFDAPLNRYVAIKMLLPHLAASGAARKRFEREGQAAAAVIDDHVLPIYAVAKWQNIPYLVMQYSSGNNLQRRIDVDGPLDVKEILRIGMQTARGLAAAHAQGLVHRDVKPSNILLDGTVERVLLTDFGLARAVDDASITRTGTIAGTPQYMSPEQARGKSVDARSDLFGLGCVLYAMCAGHPPFRAESSYAILRLITDEEPRPIREINADIPDWLCSIIGKLMSKKADERYRNAEEVAEILEQCLAHVQQPTTTPLPESLAAIEPQRNRRPPFIKCIAAAAFAFSLFFAGVLIVLELNKGTLTIESEVADVPIRITQGDNIVERLTVSKNGESVRIAAGRYVVDVDNGFDGVVVEGGAVTLKRGTSEIVRFVKTGQQSTETAQINPGDIIEVSIRWRVEAEPIPDRNVVLLARVGADGKVRLAEFGQVEASTTAEVERTIFAALQNEYFEAPLIVQARVVQSSNEAVNRKKLQPGDLVGISIRRSIRPEATMHTPAKVAENGKVLLPMIGEVDVAGMTLADLESKILDDSIAHHATGPLPIVVAQYLDPDEVTVVIETVTENVPVRVAQGTVTQQMTVTKEGKSTHAASSSGKYRMRIPANGTPTIKRVDVDTNDGKHNSDDDTSPTTRTIDYGGICIRAEDGTPIAGAVARFFILNVHGKRSSMSLLEMTTTDKDGHFRFNSEIPDDAEVDLAHSRIAITSTGRASRIFFWQGGLEPRRIEMRQSASLKGRVTDSASRPVAGARVRLGPNRMPGVNDAVTAKDGRFEIADLEKVDKFSYETGISNMLYVEHPDGSKASAIVQSIPSTVDIVLESAAGEADNGEGPGKSNTSNLNSSSLLAGENDVVWSKTIHGLRLGVRFAESELGQAQRFTPGDVGQLQIYLQNASDKAIRAGFEPTDACKAVLQITSQGGRPIPHDEILTSGEHLLPAPLSANYRTLKPDEIRPLNDDFAGTHTQSPTRQLRLGDLATFAIVDDGRGRNSVPRRYQMTPGKYVVSVTLEVYSGRDRFSFTSDRLPFEVVEAEVRDQLNSQATPQNDDPFSIDGAAVSRGKQVSGVLSAHDAISRYMKAVEGIRSFDVAVHEEKTFLYKQVPIDEPEIQGRRTRLVDYAKGDSQRIEHRYSRQIWEANGRQRVELLHGDPATGSGDKHVSTYDGERVRLLEVDSGHESTHDLAPEQKPLISYEGRYHSLFSELYVGGTLLELLQQRNDVTLSDADGLIRLTVSPQSGTMYPKYQFVYELDPAHDYLPHSISASILNRKLSRIQVTDFQRLANGKFVPLAAIHETFGFKDGVAGAVVIEHTELTVDPSRSTWNEPVVPNT